MERIYLDNAATTKPSQAVIAAMMPYYTDFWGNPSGMHGVSREAAMGLDTARRRIAKVLGAASSQEILFTSGGTESDNLAIRGILLATDRRHVVTTAIEHPAVLKTLRCLEEQGRAEVTRLLPDRAGRVSAEQVRRALRPDTALVTVMFANNEVGTVEPVAEIGSVCEAAGIPFHTDAVQAAGQLPIDVDALHVSLLSLSGHKLHGPKGTGALYVRSGIRLSPVLTGGEQERSRRAGTENVPGFVGLGAALAECADSLTEISSRIASLRDRLIDGVLSSVPGAVLTGSTDSRLPGNAHFLFDGIDSRTLLTMLDLNGVCASAGSACAAGSLEPSYVLEAMGYTPAESRGALRLTLSRDTTAEEIDRTVLLLREITASIRGGSVETAFSLARNPT